MNVFYAHSGGRHDKRSVVWLNLIALLRVYECVCLCVCVFDCITDSDTKSLSVETERYRDYQGLQVLGSQFTFFTGSLVQILIADLWSCLSTSNLDIRMQN
jgi:hypothetical protein